MSSFCYCCCCYLCPWSSSCCIAFIFNSWNHIVDIWFWWASIASSFFFWIDHVEIFLKLFQITCGRFLQIGRVCTNRFHWFLLMRWLFNNYRWWIIHFHHQWFLTIYIQFLRIAWFLWPIKWMLKPKKKKNK